jgi:Peptidase family M28
MKSRLIAVLALTVLAASPIAQQARAPEADTIREANLRADLAFLAGDAMRGRLTDTNENRLAGDYIASRFERAGLKGAGAGGSYFQGYDLMTFSLAGDAPQGGLSNALLVSAAGGRNQRVLRAGQDFYPLRFSASGHAAGPVVFVGFGISAPPLEYDDYRGDVKGKIVLALDHEPGEHDPNSPFDGLITSEWSTSWRKALAAQEKGAAAVLFVSDVHNHPNAREFDATARAYWPEKPPRIASYMLADWVDRVHIPVAQISPALAESLMSNGPKELEKASEAAHGLTPVDLAGPVVEVHTAVDRHVVPDRNVVAFVEGSDPQLRNEWVIVSAHFDHQGADGTQVFNGADDNGSGTVALLEIADAYGAAARAGRRPKRSVLFAAWNSEERGLLGAWAYTERPLHPLSSVAAVLNMDMIGRNEEIPAGGGARFSGLEPQTAESNANAVNVGGLRWAADLKAPIDAANKGVGLELKPRYDNNPSQLVRRSDQWPFLQHGVPAVGFFTGLHPDYHTQYDRPEKINYPKLEKIARLVYTASREIADAAGRPRAATGAAAK